MRKLLKSYKTEITPAPEQIQKINQTIGTCRYVYNFYLTHNREIYEKEKKFVSGINFSKWLNHVYLKENPDKLWIKEVSSKSVKQSIMNAEKAFKRFFKHQSGFPKFKKKKKSDVKMYFVKTDAKSVIQDLKKRSKKKGEATRQNIRKQVLKVQKLHQRIDNIRTDYINKCVNETVKAKPSYITIEDLNVSGMMKNKHLSKAVASQKFYEFKTKLKNKCDENGIELRIADRWFPSSKLCHECGCIKKDLKLSDRIYKCECGYIADRDYNASLNLRDAKTYKTA